MLLYLQLQSVSDSIFFFFEPVPSSDSTSYRTQLSAYLAAARVYNISGDLAAVAVLADPGSRGRERDRDSPEESAVAWRIGGMSAAAGGTWMTREVPRNPSAP